MEARKERRKRNSFIPTKVRGVRAEYEFWELLNAVTELENTTGNELIIRVVTNYCENALNKGN
jgi:predicted DNA-binding ribbon-helix-helix protein